MEMAAAVNPAGGTLLRRLVEKPPRGLFKARHDAVDPKFTWNPHAAVVVAFNEHDLNARMSATERRKLLQDRWRAAGRGMKKVAEHKEPAGCGLSQQPGQPHEVSRGAALRHR